MVRPCPVCRHPPRPCTMTTPPTRPPLTFETLVRGRNRAVAPAVPSDTPVPYKPLPAVTLVLPSRAYAFCTDERVALLRGTMLLDETVDTIGQLLISLYCSAGEAGVTSLMPSATVGMILGGYSANPDCIGSGARHASPARWASDPSEAFHSTIHRHTRSTSLFRMETVFLPIVTGGSIGSWPFSVVCQVC